MDLNGNFLKRLTLTRTRNTLSCLDQEQGTMSRAFYEFLITVEKLVL